MAIMSELRSQRSPTSDSDDSDELKTGTFRRVVNRPVSKLPRLATSEPAAFSVRVVPAVAGIVTADAAEGDKVDRVSSNTNVMHVDESESDVAVISSMRCSDKTGKPLCWQGGRLQSILLHDTFPLPKKSSNGGTQFTPVIGNATVRPIVARSSLLGSGLFHTSSPAGRGNRRENRMKKELRQHHSSDTSSEQETGNNVPAANPPVRSHSRKSNRPEPQPLLLPLKEFHPPTDLSLPMLDVTSKYDPFIGVGVDSKPGDCPTPVTNSGVGQADDGLTTGTPSSNTTTIMATSSGISSASVRMKSSGGMNDIDPQELRGHRRLNGYQLFVMVNKKKHESALTMGATDDTVESADNQRDLHRKWQAIWSTLPEKTRKEWKTKAKRLMKHTGQQSQLVSRSSQAAKRFGSSRERCQAEIRKIENQLTRSDCVSTTLVEYAAYFQLLSDSFGAAARSLAGFDGPVSPDSVETMLLDGLLSCMIPLLALAAEEPFLADVPDKRDVSRGLRHLTYLIPT